MKNNNNNTVPTSQPTFGTTIVSYPKLIEFLLFSIYVVTTTLLFVIPVLTLTIIGEISKLFFNTILFILNLFSGRKTTMKSISTDIKFKERMEALKIKLEKRNAEIQEKNKNK